MSVPSGEIVDRLWAAYNLRDIDAYCALFAPSAVVSRLNTGDVIGRGPKEIRAYYSKRFTNPRLRCEIEARIMLGEFIIDRERVEGVTEDVLEVIAIYEVRDALIQSLRIIWP